MNSIAKLLMVALTCFLTLTMNFGISAQSNTLSGPILTSSPLSGDGILFQDLNTGRTWGLWTPVPIYDFFTASSGTRWSPDGCSILIQNRRTREWGTVSLTDMIITRFPVFPEELNVVSTPFWYPDSQHLTLTVSNSVDSSTQILLLNYATQSVEVLYVNDEPITAIAWLSPTELLYSSSGDWLIWDTVSQQNSSFGTELFPRNGIPLEDSTFMRLRQRSPNFEYTTTYYSIRSYNLAIWQESFDGLTLDEFAELNERMRQPGFDLFDLNAGTSIHIDVNGEFLQALEWSPSSERIVVSTYTNSGTESGGIYVYDVSMGTLAQVGDFPALFNAEYGPYIPTWSSDEEWLTINTLDGWVTYNLLTGQTITLNNAPPDAYMSGFTGVYMRLSWSPIMDYSNSGCSTDVEP